MHSTVSAVRSAIGLAVMAAALAATASPATAQRYELSGGRVAVYNLAGEITLEPGSGSAVIVTVTRGGADGDALDVETGPLNGWETLRVLYPEDDIIYRPRGRRSRMQTTIRVREDGTFGDGNRHDRRRRGRRVEIHSSGRGFEGWADLTIQIPRGKQFAINLGAGTVSASNIDGNIHIDTHSGGVSATGMQGPLSIDTGSGSIEVTDAQGDLNLDTGSGGVDVSGIAGESLRIDTGSGSVIASQITVTDLDIDTGSGRIDVTDASAQHIVMDTGSGSVRATFHGYVENVAVDTGSGSVTLTLPETFSATVDIETGSGGIDLDFPVEVQRWERDHVRGVIGDGRGRLTIDTGSGSITIRQG